MSNLGMMQKRLEYYGGIKQEDRMVNGKYWTFLHTLNYSYQVASIRLVQPYSECCTEETDSEVNKPCRALINPDKIKQDYDDKILSVDLKENFNAGDVFEWTGTNSYWLIYLQELTERAYFRSEIRRCRYTIKFKDGDGNVKYTWAAIRGPVETQINSIQKNQIRVDQPNLSLNILLPRNDDTIHAFERYSEFLFQDRCWQVQAHDGISIPNVLEINAQEYYVDRDTDDVEKELKNGLVIEPIDPNGSASEGEEQIIGETFTRPKIAEIYIAPRAGTWSTEETNTPICLKAISETEVRAIWQKPTSGQYTLVWTDGTTTLKKIVVVESLF